MGDPYVNSGESFIRTTGRVSVNFALFDMILTTRHLILVDNTYARFEPQMIPILTILSVTAGKVATGEPVITLSFIATGSTGNLAPMNLIFTQEPGEMRKRERDEWIQLLIDHIVSAREQTIPAAAPNLKGRGRLPKGATPRPIEFALPHKTAAASDPLPSEIVILPDEVELPAVEKKDSSPQSTPALPVEPEPTREELQDSSDSFTIASQAAIQTSSASPGNIVSENTGTPQVPVPEEPVGNQKEETGTPQTSSPAVAEPGKYEELPDKTTEAGTESHAPPSPPPPPASRSGWNITVVVSVLVVIILAVVGGMFFNPQNGPGVNTSPRIPLVTTSPTLPEIPAPVLIPENGVWVRVQYNGTFIGYVGNPGALQHVGGSGDRFYYITKSDGLVQAVFQKQDNTGNALTIEVYRDGDKVLHRSTRVPKGEVQFIIDPKTGNPPGVNVTAATK